MEDQAHTRYGQTSLNSVPIQVKKKKKKEEEKKKAGSGPRCAGEVRLLGTSCIHSSST